MNIELLREALGWITVINMGLFMLWFIIYALAGDWMYRLHGRWFELSKEQFNALHYAGMMFFKLFILMFNLVPYLVLHIIT